MITEQQRKERTNAIGGSDIPVIMGMSPYKTPYKLYLEKTCQIVDESDNEAMYWGNVLEPVIREEFERRNNVKVETKETIVHPFYDFMRGNIDGFIPAWDSVLEIKTSSQFMDKNWGEDGSDTIPMQHLLQVAYYCMLTNAKSAHIAVLIGGNKYKQYEYTRDFDIENRIILAAKEFWDCVQNKTPPAAVDRSDLLSMYSSHKDEKKVHVVPEIKKQLNDLVDTRFKIKKLEEVEEKYKFNIMQFMQDAECLTDELGMPIVSWRANKRGTRTFLMKGI